MRNQRAMDNKPEDSPTLVEQMNRALYLYPGFNPDKPTLVKAIRADIDDTTKRAQANVDQQRQNTSDVELLSKYLAREEARKKAAQDVQDVKEDGNADLPDQT